MAVPEQTPYSEHTGNGVTKSFSLGFICESKNDLIVMVDEIEPPIASWSLVGGNVVFATAPAAGQKITLQRNTPFNRTAEYQSFNNSFRPQTVNVDFDRIWLKLQELGVADWLMKLYVDRLHQQQEQKINDLKGYVDDRDDELRAYLLEEIRKQGVALDQLDEYYNYLMQRLAQIAIDRGWAAEFVVTPSGETQQEINDYTGAKWRNKINGYSVGDRVRLENGDIVKSTVANNTINPNLDMTGWIPDQYSNYGTTRAKTRSVQNKLKDIPSILDWDADSANDDSSRIRKALLDGVDSLFIPPKSSYGVFKVGELELTKSIKLWGVGGQGIDQQGSVIQKVDGASYALHFNGLGLTSRPLGGGLFDVTVQGVASENADLVRVTRWSYFKALNTALQNSRGWGLKLRNVMESTFNTNNFRRLGSESTGIILFDDYIDIDTENCNNIHIKGNTFALSSGDWIKSTEQSNPDLIWINNNKFEYDGTPSGNANAQAKWVMNFGQMARSFIKDNGFTLFRTANNKYSGVLRMGVGCNGMGVEFAGNNLLGCEKPWQVEGGRLIAHHNEGVSLSGTETNTSKNACDIEPVVRKESNGNLAYNIAFNKKSQLAAQGFISCHDLTGTIGNYYTPVVDALFETSLQIVTTSALKEIKRLQLSPDLVTAGKVLRIRARVKNGGDTTTAIRLNLNNTTNITLGLLSGETGFVHYIATDQTAFKDYEWYITPDQIGAGSLRFIAEEPNSTLLFDGVYVEVVKSIPFSIGWSDIGTLTAGQIKQSSTRDLRIKNYIASFGSVLPDVSDVGLIYSINLAADKTYRAQVYNANNASVTTTVNTVRFQINLA